MGGGMEYGGSIETARGGGRGERRCRAYRDRLAWRLGCFGAWAGYAFANQWLVYRWDYARDPLPGLVAVRNAVAPWALRMADARVPESHGGYYLALFLFAGAQFGWLYALGRILHRSCGRPGYGLALAAMAVPSFVHGWGNAPSLAGAAAAGLLLGMAWLAARRGEAWWRGFGGRRPGRAIAETAARPASRPLPFPAR